MTKPKIHDKYTLGEPGYYWENRGDSVNLVRLNENRYIAYMDTGDGACVSNYGKHVRWYGPLSMPPHPWKGNEND